jgi:hypothetical protein
MHPAGEPDGLADILFPQLATGFGAIGMHDRKTKVRWEDRAGTAHGTTRLVKASGGFGTKREQPSLLAMRHIEGEFQCLGLLGAFP